MKRAFTMIELIFVIVILGILAAVAIPKLAATRDDAQISAAASNITTAASDIASYYFSQGKFATDLQSMTNVTLPIKIKDKICADIIIDNEKQIKIKKGIDGACKQVWQTGILRNATTSLFSDAIILVE